MLQKWTTWICLPSYALESTPVCCRSQCLQRAKTSLKNYRADYESLNLWLSRIPNYEVRETDDSRQVESKLKSQRVRPLAIHVSMFLKMTPGHNSPLHGLVHIAFVQGLLSDIAKKESDLNNVSKNADLYQRAIKVRPSHLFTTRVLIYFQIMERITPLVLPEGL